MLGRALLQINCRVPAVLICVISNSFNVNLKVQSIGPTCIVIAMERL